MRVFIFLVVAFCFAPFSFAADISGKVKITDGDTMVVADKKIRLHGIDAPERRALCIVNGKKWACADAATHLLRQLIADKEVSCDKQAIDRYGRVVAKCYLERVDISEILTLTGWTMAMPKYSEDYVDTENMARQAGRGLWRQN
ncbi:MAG: thermonuclease family protein [Alphaproteobacteria bacterium]